MAKLELGEKYSCQNCSTRFYDLCKSPPTCPKCGSEHQPPLKRSQTISKKVKGAEKQRVVQPDNAEDELIDVEDLEVIETDVSQDEELMEDTSDLGDNGDEMPDVKGHEDIDNMEK